MYAEGTGGAVVVRDAQVRDPVVCGRLHGLVPRMAYFIAYLRYGVRHMTDGLFRVCRARIGSTCTTKASPRCTLFATKQFTGKHMPHKWKEWFSPSVGGGDI